MKRIIITAILTFALAAFAIKAVEQTAFKGAGVIESTTGGFKFPDGSVQTSAATQMGPVLHDADDVPIGYVVSISALPNGQRIVKMISGQGYMAVLPYFTGSDSIGRSDRLGFPAARFYESDDCTGDPVVLPIENADYHGIRNYYDVPGNVVGGDIYYSRRADGFASAFGAGDLVEYGNEVLYIPFDAPETTILTRSFLPVPTAPSTTCWIINRCDLDEQAYFSHLVTRIVEPLEEPPGGWCVHENPSPTGQITIFGATGFRLSSLLVNDPTTTGFQSSDYNMPVRVKHEDINAVLSGY